LGTSSSLASADAFQGIPASMLRVAIEGARQRARHLEPALAAMLDCGVTLVLVNQHEKAFRSSQRPPTRRGDIGRPLGPAAFQQPSLRRLFPASASATVISRATQGNVRALAIAPVQLTRCHAVIVETRLALGIPWIELITKAVPGLPLISAAKGAAA
jgi:hypothetical protein